MCVCPALCPYGQAEVCACLYVCGGGGYVVCVCGGGGMLYVCVWGGV